MKLFQRSTKRPIKSNPKYEEMILNNRSWKVDEQLIKCIKAAVKYDFPDHKPVFDIIEIDTANERYGRPADVITIDLRDLLVTYTILEENGYYKPIGVKWEYKN